MTRATSGPVDGWVVFWHDKKGWGTLTSPVVDGEVWAHFSSIVGTGYKTMTAGEAVSIVYETPGQDGYPHRAVSVSRRS